MGRAWPVRLAQDWNGTQVVLRPLRVWADKREFMALREANAAWTRPWDSTSPRGPRIVSFAELVREQNVEARHGRMLPFAVEVDGQLAGQMHLFGITRGALLSGAAGYWISQRFAGRGITPTSVALATDLCFRELGLHRMEICIRPENTASLRVVQKLGFRYEGLRRRFIHIAGDWRDHHAFALVREEVPEGVLQRWLNGDVPEDAAAVPGL